MPANVSIYKRASRLHWSISFIDVVSGKRLHRVTVFRIDNPAGHRKTFDLATRKSFETKHLREITKEEAWDQ